MLLIPLSVLHLCDSVILTVKTVIVVTCHQSCIISNHSLQTCLLCLCICCRWCCWKKLRLKHSAQRTNSLWRKSWQRKQKWKTLPSLLFLTLVWCCQCHAVTEMLKMGAYRSLKVVEFKIKIFQAWKVTESSQGAGRSWKINQMVATFLNCVPKPDLAAGLCPDALRELKCCPRPPSHTWLNSPRKPLSVFYMHPVKTWPK